MKNTIKFYFNFDDFIENAKQIREQLEYEGYNCCWLTLDMNKVIVVYTLIGDRK